MHWGKERGSMNERAWERESENSRTLPSFQAANLCSQSTLWQRRACKDTKPSSEFGFASNPPAIAPRERRGGTPRSRGAVSPRDTAGASPVPPAPQHPPQRRVSCLLGQTQRNKRVIPWMHTWDVASPGRRDVPLPSAWVLARVEWAWGAPLLPQILFLHHFPVFLGDF